MKIPRSVPIEYGVECHHCHEKFIVIGKADKAITAARELLERLEHIGWLPLSMGKHCIGLICKTCQPEFTDDNSYADKDAEDINLEEQPEGSGDL